MTWPLAPSAPATRRFEEVMKALRSLLYKYCLTTPPPWCIIFSNSQSCGQAVLTTLIFFSKHWTANHHSASVMNQFAVVGVIVLLLLYIHREYRIYSTLKEFGGPPTTGFSRLWLLIATYSGKMNLHFDGVNDEHGMQSLVTLNMHV